VHFPILLTGPPCISGSGVTRQPVFRVKRQGAAFVGGRAAVAVVAVPRVGDLVVGVEGAGGSLEARRIAGAARRATVIAEGVGVAAGSRAGLSRELAAIHLRVGRLPVVVG